jgi:hypothetical protein
VPTFHSTDYVRLDPGEYQLISFQRPGSASGGLNPPTNRCEQRIRVTGNPKLTILISAQAFEGCNIEGVQTLEIAGS